MRNYDTLFVSGAGASILSSFIYDEYLLLNLVIGFGIGWLLWKKEQTRKVKG